MPNSNVDSVEMIFIKQLAKHLREKIPACKQEKFNTEEKFCLSCEFFNDCYILADATRIFNTPL